MKDPEDMEHPQDLEHREGETIAGVDEAGRGPLAGPVVAAAVVLPRGAVLPGLADSKSLSAGCRAEVAVRVRARAVAWALGQADPAEIDRLNVLEATLLAMRRALAGLAAHGVAPTFALIDGNRCPEGLPFPARAVVRGDATVPAISAASILAKTWRDREMERLGRCWPEYGFADHKGYPTPAHLERVRRFGPCPIHRRSFGPVRRAAGEGAGTSGGVGHVGRVRRPGGR